MTPQQYDKINGLNALGGCLGFLCLFGVFPLVFALTENLLISIGAFILSSALAAGWIGRMKEKV